MFGRQPSFQGKKSFNGLYQVKVHWLQTPEDLNEMESSLVFKENLHKGQNKGTVVIDSPIGLIKIKFSETTKACLLFPTGNHCSSVTSS